MFGPNRHLAALCRDILFILRRLRRPSYGSAPKPGGVAGGPQPEQPNGPSNPDKKPASRWSDLISHVCAAIAADFMWAIAKPWVEPPLGEVGSYALHLLHVVYDAAVTSAIEVLDVVIELLIWFATVWPG